MSAIALLVAATLAQAGTLRSDLALRGGGAGRSVVSLLAMDKGGSQDWGAGIPTPTIDCAAVGTSSSASLQCSGASPSFAGTAQTAAGSPWWYRNDTAVRPAIALNGSTDYWGLGDVADPAGSAMWCGGFRPDSVTGDQMLMAKDTSGDDGWFIYRSSAQLKIYVYNAAGTPTAYTIGTVVTGAWFGFCVAYEYVGNGTSIIRANVNGTAASDVTNAVGPIKNTATALKIGARGNTAELLWSGGIRRLAYWDGPPISATSAAALAAIVATQWGLAHDKPAGTVATHARTDSTLCCPFSDAECFWVGPGAPCIHAPTYSGWASGGAVAGGIEVYGPGANALAYSETFAAGSWIKAGGVGAADNSASCPMSPLAGTRMSLVTTDGEADYITQDAATTPGRSVWLARATGDSACGVTFGDATGDGAQSLALTDGPVRYYSGGTGQTGLSVARPVGGCARWCMWLAQAQASTYPVPYRTVAAGTPYSGAASTATTLTVPVALTDPSRWAISMTATGPLTTRGLWSWGTIGAANSVGLYETTDVLAFALWDASAASRSTLYTLPAAPSSTRIVASDGMRLSVNDVVVGTTSGAGSGALSALPSGPLKIGDNQATGVYLGGLVSRVAQCRRAGGCR